MRKARTPLALLLALFVIGTVAVAANGIEVLSMQSAGDGYWAETRTHGALVGYTMEAVTTIDGNPCVVDVTSIDAETGIAWVNFPVADPTNTLVVRDEAGGVYSIATIESDAPPYGGILEFD